MKKIILQRIGSTLMPASIEYLKAIMSFKENEPIQAQLSGKFKARSWKQLKWIHAVLRFTSDNLDNPDLNTIEKLKFYVKVRIRFITNEIFIDGAGVFLDVRSFSYDDLSDPVEANQVFTQVKNECASLLGVDPMELDAKAKEDSKMNVRGENG